MKKILEPIFVYFSKIYIFFYKDKGEKWSILPVVVLATIITFNLEVVSFFFFETSKYYLIALYVLIMIYLDHLFKNTNYEYVKNYQQSNKTKISISTVIFIDLVLSFVFLNISRNGNFLF